MTLILQICVVIITSALLQTVTSANFNDTIFAVTTSSKVTGGKDEPVCAQIHGPTEPVTLTVSLETSSRTVVILKEAVNQDFYRCINYRFPVVTSSTVVSITVKVQGQSGGMAESTKILIQPENFVHIVQTDKPIYKPGQTVNFRIVSLDTNFIPVNRVYTVVALQDPKSNCIAQWLDKSIEGGILDLSHRMIPEAELGVYTITASTDKGEKILHTFTIKEYVLPKYEVTVHLPKVISILDKEATLRVCGKYTYGKPVIGSVKAVVCRKGYSYYWSSAVHDDICKTYELTTEKNGCATQIINMLDFSPTAKILSILVVNAEIQEHGTGVILEGSEKAEFSHYIRSVKFVDIPSAYKRGIPFEGKVKMVGPGDKPVVDEQVYLDVDGTQMTILTTDRSGMASFSLETSQWFGSKNLRGGSKNTTEDRRYMEDYLVPQYQEEYHIIKPFYSKSSSFLKLLQIDGKLSCDRDATLHAQYILQGEELNNRQEVLDFFYLVVSRGGIVQHSRVPVAVRAGTVNKGQLTITLQHMTNLSPFAQVVVYTVMPKGEIVADSQDFPVQLCLNNKVSLKFSSIQQLPAEKTTLSLQAQPGSICSVRAIDQSVLLLQQEQELTVDHVYSKLPTQKLSGYDYRIQDPDIGRAYCRPDMKDDIYSVFEDVGIKIMTNSDVIRKHYCGSWVMFFEGEQHRVGVAPDAKETVRTYFPETWIWELVSLGEGSSVDVEKVVPDTITKWVAGAFCVSPVGFGVSPSVELTAFQPFFVSLTLPYSVIRGEVFTLKATVFNYLSKCIMVNVTLADSDLYTFRACDGCEYTACLCENESRTFSWIVTPTALGEMDLKVSAEALRTDVLCGNEVAAVPDQGRIDTVIRKLLVQAEGMPQMISHNALLCPTDGPVEKKISLLMPEMFVAGSERASVSVLGDLMGRAMKNLDKLLAMPYGCGEQNMVLFAPNIFILNYLKSTGQLTTEILNRATNFLERGYQKELTYKHKDGSYSAFGERDESGNTWLTSFVMKSFGGAKPYIFIDDKHIKIARTWLGSHQRPDGCIQSVGKLFHNGMKGGVSDDVSLTAYVTAAMLELDANVTEPVVQNCLNCLKRAVATQMDNLYTTALLSYTFTLAADEDMRSKLITHLHEKSKEEGGTRHWAREGASKKKLDSLEVEMTSYVLLALLSGPDMPNFGLDYSSSIVRWLTQQQNSYGGFSSTQDTVVALQALAKYGTATYSEEGTTTVTVTSLGEVNKEFTVDKNNRLLYQEEKLTEIPGEYTIRARGLSCVLAQISLHYNIPPPPDFSSFHIAATTLVNCNISRPQLNLSVEVRYQGRREETNMVILNVKLLSGHVPDMSSLTELKKSHLVKRVDVEEGFINIYLDGLRKDATLLYTMTLEEDQPVRNLKPAVVKVYDYYQTSDEAVTDYTSSCAESDNVNEL